MNYDNLLCCICYTDNHNNITVCERDICKQYVCLNCYNNYIKLNKHPRCSCGEHKKNNKSLEVLGEVLRILLSYNINGIQIF